MKFSMLFVLVLMLSLATKANESDTLRDICDYTREVIFTAASMRADGHTLSDVIARLNKNHKINGKSTFAMQLRLTSMVYSEPLAKIQNPQEYARQANARCTRAISGSKQKPVRGGE